MKKIIAAFLLTGMLSASLIGCSEENGSSSGATEGSQQAAVTEAEALAENQSQIVGNVSSIIGNEVVLALGEVKENASAGGMDSSGGADSQKDSSDGSSMSRPSGENAFPEGGSFPEGEMPSGGRGSGNFQGGERPSGDFSGGEMPGGDFESGAMQQGGMSGGRQNTEITLTGESATYLIPVGLTLSGASGTVSDFSAISEGMSLRLTLETTEDNQQNIVAVEVISR